MRFLVHQIHECFESLILHVQTMLSHIQWSDSEFALNECAKQRCTSENKSYFIGTLGESRCLLSHWGGADLYWATRAEQISTWTFVQPISQQTHVLMSKKIIWNRQISMYVPSYVPIYLCTYVCTFVWMYVCTFVCYICTHVLMCLCTCAPMYLSTFVWMYVCTYVPAYACM